jgi:zinc/manganese transport system substrate-binding protein
VVRGKLLASAAVALVTVAAGCAKPSSSGTSEDGPLRVVAAENVWGSIAAELAGDRAQVSSIVSSPAADPHDYEPSGADARAFADAKLAIVNGIGYDSWASKLLAANPVAGRIELNVGSLLGIARGGNPHRWYSPTDVRRMTDAISRDYALLDPGDAMYFRRERARFQNRSLAEYGRLLASIRRRYGGVPVGASESIFEPLAQAVGLKLLTPPSFLKAISEGADPTAADRRTIERQIARGEIAVWIYNRQNSTPDVTRLVAAARRKGIPVVTITETLVPASATFEAWQVRQLRELEAALRQATDR